jgi:uncharacterized protein Yka (UPF0111/DUF47 family)
MGLLPRDEAFYTLFVDQSSRIVEAAGIFNAAFQADLTDWDAAIGRLDQLEVAGDKCAHETVARLARSFITPFDPEDIHRLAVALNAVLDALNGLAQRCRIYGLGSPPPEPMRRLASSIEQGAKACHTAVSAMAADQDAPDALAEARRLEHEADKIYRAAMLALFRSESDLRTLLTDQQIYDGLEAATDRFEALSYLIAEIRLKNS